MTQYFEGMYCFNHLIYEADDSRIPEKLISTDKTARFRNHSKHNKYNFYRREDPKS